MVSFSTTLHPSFKQNASPFARMNATCRVMIAPASKEIHWIIVSRLPDIERVLRKEDTAANIVYAPFILWHIMQ